MKFSTKTLTQIITQLCKAYGIDHIVISAGSRNAPLTIGFTGDEKFNNFCIVDERCAAFFALGMAQHLKRPVVLVCTSGSALLNYYPAIAEAFYSDIPLVIISADRPAHLIEIGDGQTVRQENVFVNHILYSANCIAGDDHKEHNENAVNKALATALEHNGPVHINAPFEEPLYETTDALGIVAKKISLKIPSEEIIEDLAPFIDIWNLSSKKMILAGVFAPDSIEQKYIDLLASNKSVIVLTETTSNLHHPNFFPAIDQLIDPLNTESLENLRPNLLLTFGGMIVSKKIKAFLRTYSPKVHWHVDPKKAYDTFFKLKHHFRMEPNTFFKAFLPNTDYVESNYQMEWKVIREYREQKHLEFEKKIRFSDFLVFSIIIKSLPKKIQLQLSNSTAIRYCQLFRLDPSLQVFCNRGTSGIDGSTSTAIGSACASNLPTVFITGDLSFLYDSNALWNNYMPKSFRIILINNGGGGIFRILPNAKNIDHFETFFETSHSYTAIHLCEMFGIEYLSANNAQNLQTGLDKFYKASERPKLLEVFTPSEVNDLVLAEYFQYIK
jgi:2-succinyl-5-enolpyruvyl-6-hydroxy-3-cyclohexene-1-carboxylate synthase